MGFASTSKASKTVGVLGGGGCLLVGWLVGSAHDIRALGQRVQTEISELGTKTPKLPQTSTRHNETVFPRIKQQGTEGT